MSDVNAGQRKVRDKFLKQIRKRGLRSFGHMHAAEAPLIEYLRRRTIEAEETTDE